MASKAPLESPKSIAVGFSKTTSEIPGLVVTLKAHHAWGSILLYVMSESVARLILRVYSSRPVID